MNVPFSPQIVLKDTAYCVLLLLLLCTLEQETQSVPQTVNQPGDWDAPVQRRANYVGWRQWRLGGER